jgi:hypothetical protein
MTAPRRAALKPSDVALSSDTAAMPAQIADLLATERFRLENEANDREIVRQRAERLTPEWMT